MAHLRKAPWPKRQLSMEEFQQVFVACLRDRACWRVGKVLGSMLFFDFGAKVSVPRLKGGFVEAGQATISVNDCHWKLFVGGEMVTDSDSITDEQGRDLLKHFEGSDLCAVTVMDADCIHLVFSNGTHLSVDTTNQYGTDDPIIDFVAPSGEIYKMSADGLLYLTDVVSSTRFVH